MLEKLDTELKLRGFSDQTVRTYIFHNNRFLEFIRKDVEDVDEDDIKQYLGKLIAEKKSPSSVALAKSALKFYYGDVLSKDIVNFKTPKPDKKLPSILSKDEVKRLLEVTKNFKHKLIIELLYSSGLRLSECINLKINDLEFDERIGWVRKGKGRKDRLFILSERLVEHIKKYIKKRKTESEYLFTGYKGRMSPRNVQKIIGMATKNAGITKKVSPHTLRHCFATHLLEAGVDIRKIQELLGHANLQTTQIYTKVSKEELKKVKSPLDTLF